MKKTLKEKNKSVRQNESPVAENLSPENANSVDSEGLNEAVVAEPAYDSNGNAVAGLSTADVKQRIEEGKINGDQNVRTKTVGEIFRTNIFTFFNILFIVIALILIFFIPQNTNGYAQFGFMMLVIINTTIGIIQELKAKKTIDKLSLRK